MAKLFAKVNVGEAEKMGDFTPLPPGHYVAHITESEMKETRNKEGHYLQLTFEVLEGEHAKRKFWDRLNLDNKNEQTVAIANKQLATIGECCGIEMLEDSEQLHNIPLVVKLNVKEASAQFAESNEVKGYTKYEGEGSVPSGPAADGEAQPPKKASKPAAASPPTKKAGGKKPAWKKK